MVEVIVCVAVIALIAIGILCEYRLQYLIWLSNDYNENWTNYKDIPKGIEYNMENIVKWTNLVVLKYAAVIIDILIIIGYLVIELF